LSRDIHRWWAMARGKDDPFLTIGETNDRSTKGKSDVVWSLKNIDFEIEKGDAVGIIGRNGAGKSTLLKVLSQVTTPTSGKVKIKGRIASLLEVGTGFHPELSGRENVFLNGAILGMRKKEIVSKFDEIVDFSGVERYIDTPVKRYSSGMYVRLAFAVAAHLQSEILIVDEVLAVGDYDFQKKCLGKMNEVSSSEGRTILFVSHNMGSVVKLCRNAILLNKGEVELSGEAATVVNAYHTEAEAEETYKRRGHSDNEIFIKEAATYNYNDEQVNSFAHTESIFLRIRIGINKLETVHNIGIVLYTKLGIRLFTVNKFLSDLKVNNMDEVVVSFEIEKGLLATQEYYFLIALNSRDGSVSYDILENVCSFKVYDNGSELSFLEGQNYGCILYEGKWRLIR